MADTTIAVPTTRNMHATVITLGANVEQSVDFVFPAGVDACELWLYPVPTDVKIAGAAAVATGDKTPVPTAGFPINFRRKAGETGAVTLSTWLHSTTGGKVGSWVR